jgi:hypothetical protein
LRHLIHERLLAPLGPTGAFLGKRVPDKNESEEEQCRYQ